MSWHKRIQFAGLILGLVSGLAGTGIYAEELSEAKKPEILFEMLDCNSCQRRNLAWGELSLQVQETAEPLVLLAAIQNELKKTSISFEAQERLESLEQELKKRVKSEKKSEEISEKNEPTQNWGQNELEKLPIWNLLTSESPVKRSQAEREVRLLILAGEKKGEILDILRGIIIQEELSTDDRLRLWKLEQFARKNWLETGDFEQNWLGVTETQLKESVDFLATAILPEYRLAPWFDLCNRTKTTFSITSFEEPFGGDGFSFLDFENPETGKREGLKVWKELQFLEDVLACEENKARVLQVINEKLEQESVTSTGKILLQRLQFLTFPCMAAEYWLNGKFRAAQILQIGVPQNCGLGISFFDSSTDETAHCQQGANLAVRDYLWNVAILHPKQPAAFFHLVPLKSVKSKLLYASRIVENPEERLRLISEKTFQKLNLEQEEMRNLVELLPLVDARVASRQAGAWLEDPAMKEFHEKICVFLNDRGTKEAVPALIKHLEKGEPIWYRLNVNNRVRVDWLAILNIAERDPWDGVESWLKEQMQKQVLLVDKILPFDESPMVVTSPKVQLSTQENEVSVNVENFPNLTASARAVLHNLECASREDLREVKVGEYQLGKPLWHTALE